MSLTRSSPELSQWSNRTTVADRNAIAPMHADRDWLGEVRSSSAPGPTSSSALGRGSEAPPASGPDAEGAFAAARIQMQRGHLQLALLFAKQACDAEPRRAEYQ